MSSRSVGIFLAKKWSRITPRMLDIARVTIKIILALLTEFSLARIFLIALNIAK